MGTSIHLPGELLERLDRLAADLGTSRNRLIADCCRELVERHRQQWPPGYLDGVHLGSGDADVLNESAESFVGEIERTRRNRGDSPF
jgi:predicted transcriptional regulator